MKKKIKLTPEQIKKLENRVRHLSQEQKDEADDKVSSQMELDAGKKIMETFPAPQEKDQSSTDILRKERNWQAIQDAISSGPVDNKPTKKPWAWMTVTLAVAAAAALYFQTTTPTKYEDTLKGNSGDVDLCEIQPVSSDGRLEADRKTGHFSVSSWPVGLLTKCRNSGFIHVRSSSIPKPFMNIPVSQYFEVLEHNENELLLKIDAGDVLSTVYTPQPIDNQEDSEKFWQIATEHSLWKRQLVFGGNDR